MVTHTKKFCTPWLSLEIPSLHHGRKPLEHHVIVSSLLHYTPSTKSPDTRIHTRPTLTSNPWVMLLHLALWQGFKWRGRCCLLSRGLEEAWRSAEGQAAVTERTLIDRNFRTTSCLHCSLRQGPGQEPAGEPQWRGPAPLYWEVV